ncbi:fumarylacetoacetase [Piscinibacter sp. XHJ-5]|uniref:fumarylacetoacetase n=1 Tax=Piscinibacter sp. XHJ-5 TaxID=3037797 RepID=UPI002452AA2D|nr:fumarylacetoacetase [Piscinibacter sp. XHJ-5]
MNSLDDTHDQALLSWVASANEPGCDFPIQNLPFGRFRRAGSLEPWHVGVAIGDRILDLTLACDKPGWTDAEKERLLPLAQGSLSGFMALGAQARAALRRQLSLALREGSSWQPVLVDCLVPQAQAVMTLPCEVGDYTDFYTGIHHATTVGKLFRPDNPLLPNYKYVPIGYHGRSSSLCASGHAFHRPMGQLKGDAPEPRFAPTARLDYELELGALIGPGNELGEPITMANAEAHLFGVMLLNDWTARDVQSWEYQPLGPFLSKNFASTLSPWVVTMEALAPFRAPFERPAGDPAPLPYLDSEANRTQGALDIALEVWLQTAGMRERGEAAVRLMQSNFRDAYWTLAQLVAHHSSNGCNLRTADLLGSGTQSGPQPGQGGSLLELTQGGKQSITLSNGETRTFLQDGDTVILRGFCERAGRRRIGFGDCAATVLPARTLSSTL